MNLTNDKNTNNLIKLGIFAGVGFLAYNLLNNAFKNFGSSTGQNPGNVFTPTPPPGAQQSGSNCNIPNLRAMVIRNQVDSINSDLSGVNWFNYPDTTNVLLGYNQCELEYAHNYHLATYGQTLYNLISGEWDTDGDYDAVEIKLKQAGFGF